MQQRKDGGRGVDMICDGETLEVASAGKEEEKKLQRKQQTLTQQQRLRLSRHLANEDDWHLRQENNI